MIRPTQYFRSLYTCRSQLEEVLLLDLTVKFFKQLNTLCTIRGLLAWSHKRHLFLVSQYGKMTSSCLFFSFYYIGHIWPTYQVDQPHSQTIDSILGEVLFLPLIEISHTAGPGSKGAAAPARDRHGSLR